jgi:poly-beta-1,6 N-acetyl-D-glucosamine export porin PgaA
MLGLGLLSHGVQADEPESVTQARTAAVALANSGKLDEAIAALQQLRQSQPDALYVNSDLILLLRRADRNGEISTLTQGMAPDQVADYAILSWAGALRDNKDFDRARALLAAWREKLGTSGQILYAMTSLEAGLTAEAVAALPDKNTPGLNSTDLANMAYVVRRAGDPTQALALSVQAIKAEPDNPDAQREEIYALSALGAHELALQKATLKPELFSTTVLNRLQANVTTQQIRDAIEERRRLSDLGNENRDAALLDSLKTLQSERAAAKNDPEQETRARYDQIYVLRTLEMMPQAIAEYEALPQLGTPGGETSIPAYVRKAAGDAYLDTRQPGKAAAIYEQLLKENPKADVDLFISLYYAYLDSEQHDKATALAEQLRGETPVWLGQPYTIENEERADADLLWAMNPLYGNAESLAYTRISELVDKAPASVNFINAKASVERARGWPTLSMQTTQIAAGYEPKSKDTRINLAENYRALENWDLWGSEITALAKLYPNDALIKKSYLAYQDRTRPSISSEFTTGLSSGGNAVSGTRDRELRTRLNAPWTDDDWRVFLDQRYIWADFSQGDENYNRYGVGVEWRRDRKHAWAIVDNEQLSGDDAGLTLGWSQWLDDSWQYTITGSTFSTQTPLLAKQAGLSGRSIDGRVNWRQSESLDAYATLGVLFIEDGNERYNIGGGMTQRLHATPNHITSGGFDLLAEINSEPGGPYFSPANMESAVLRLEHYWLTWREYERSFAQYFRLSGGFRHQNNFGTDPIVDLFYEHDWTFSRTWALRYGIGWSSNVYDGGRERRTYGLIGFEGIF